MAAQLQRILAAGRAPVRARAGVWPQATVPRTAALVSLAAAALAAWSILAASPPAQAQDRAARSSAAPIPPVASDRKPAGNAPPVSLPAEKLQGTRLVDTYANLSIDLPGPGWEWSALSYSAPWLHNAYAASNQALGKRFVVMVFEPKLSSLPPSFLDGIIKRMPNGGAGITFEDMAVPPGAKRYRFNIQRGGMTIHCTDYIVATGHPVIFQSCSRQPADPPELGPWLASFRTLREVAPSRAASGPANPLFFFMIFFVIVGIGGMINYVAGRLVVNGWKVGGFTVATLAVIAFVVPFAFGRLADKDAGESGRLFGDILGRALIPLMLSVVGSNWVRRRRQRQALAELADSEPECPTSPSPQ
jgi:hypothetical protein